MLKWSLPIVIALPMLCSLSHGEDRMAVPEKESLAEAEKTVKDVFKADYAKFAPADRLALAQKLLQQGIETKDLPSRFVMLREAVTLAGQAGDAETAGKAIDETAKSFAVDALSLKTDMLSRCATTATSIEAAKSMTNLIFSTIEAAISEDNYEVANRLSASGEATARKTRDMALITSSQALSKEVRELQAEYAKVKIAKQTLQEKQDDPEAALIYGKFLAFGKRDPAGFALLTKGNDPELKIIAERETQVAADPDGQAGLADLYLKSAQREAGYLKRAYQERAAKLLQAAFPKSTGLGKTKVQQSLIALLPTLGIGKNSLENLSKSAKGICDPEVAKDNHPASELIDGDLTTGVHLGGYLSSKVPSYLAIELETICLVKSVRLRIRMKAGGYALNDFKLEVGIEEADSKKVAELKQGKGENLKIEEDGFLAWVTWESPQPVPLRTVRIIQDRLKNNGMVFEVEIMGVRP